MTAFLGVLLIAVASSTILSPSIHAGASSLPTASPAKTATKPVITFGIQPAGLTKPDGRGYFDLNTTPGGRFLDRVAVENYSYQRIVLTLHASDATNTSQGAFALLPPNQPSKDLGTWLSLPPRQVTVAVPPRGFVIVPFNLVVPMNAIPGDHVGGILATLQSSISSLSGQKFKLLQSVGTRIFVRVSGPLHPGFTIENLAVRYQGTVDPIGSGRAEVTYVVRNTGNVALGGKQTVWVTGLFGSKTYAKSTPVVQLLLPGSSLQQKVLFPDVFPELQMTAHVSISPLVVPGSVQPPSGPYVASITFWAIPWLLVAIILLVLLAVVTWFIRRRRKGKSKEAGGTPLDSGVEPTKLDANGATPDAAGPGPQKQTSPSGRATPTQESEV